MIKQSSSKNWKQINFRSVDTMLAVEFLHDLYNRHYPNINSIRFRNTMLIVKDNEVTSYAPTDEWDFLAEWFGERFLRDDIYVYQEVENLIAYTKPVLHDLMKRLETTDFAKLDDIALGLALIDVQFITLGEIYRVNVVQIEHALTYAINKQLEKYFPSEKERQEAFAKLIMATEPTVAVQEEIKFFEIVLDGIVNGHMYIKVEETNNIIQKIKEHQSHYGFIHSAYGASPYDVNEYIRKYNELIKNGKEEITKRLDDFKAKKSEIEKEKAPYEEKIKTDTLLQKNIDIFVRLGSLRDRNKALCQVPKKLEKKFSLCRYCSRKELGLIARVEWMR